MKRKPVKAKPRKVDMDALAKKAMEQFKKALAHLAKA